MVTSSRFTLRNSQKSGAPSFNANSTPNIEIQALQYATVNVMLNQPEAANQLQELTISYPNVERASVLIVN
jgi:hypothetical protein